MDLNLRSPFWSVNLFIENWRFLSLKVKDNNWLIAK